ncbi:MAG: hypothetical protein ACYC27_12950 [Armatimonadota bacterium]
MLLTTFINNPFSQNWEKVTEGRMRAEYRYTPVSIPDDKSSG